ncbi:glyoxylate/hydroxypyruvate reductase A [Variovorax paradoxus]|jgi:glyoxylate/hydroxypyruvate reductase A|uniref:Glyoxylate/hydroxypyruvate reductase A n=1 Tax=Variovorax paradoxus TaxID=34073 RepID=A0AAE3XTX6_VARPD|nr:MULTISPECIES: glyoxylate/hydroxypyruvate reductase A [Variovorax]MBD9663854.1 glyoxylate/hydroxypyruvate reductase A [Variovorax sp. VRV01]MDR6424212.1 glyoxylate/hydroxypyruvate reductase A [Variovorax paradoxus]MDR6452514.1 glyoxylate/hydroxypyruvate reductase A [Variovorax paradoxus]
MTFPEAAAVGTLAFYSDFDDFQTWKKALQTQLPALQVIHASQTERPEEIDYAMVWKPPQGIFERMTNLRLIINLGAGVDSLVGRDDLPRNIPITRITDPQMSRMMAGYVLFAVLRHARDIPVFEQAQRAGRWAYRHPRSPEEITVAVLGLGHLGAKAAHEIQRQGFRTLGWSRSLAQIDGVECSAGMETLDSVIGQADIVVLMLPLTPQTKQLFDRARLEKLQPGAALINVARGALVDQAALTELLQSGHIGAATLDVFEREPLPAGDALWSMPNVLITPHLASVAIPSSSARQIAANILRVSAGELPDNIVEPSRGY